VHCRGAPQAVADIIRTTLGPRSMLKMLLDASGGAWRRLGARAPRAASAARGGSLVRRR
jgi:hypothetical protein